MKQAAAEDRTIREGMEFVLKRRAKPRQSDHDKVILLVNAGYAGGDVAKLFPKAVRDIRRLLRIRGDQGTNAL